MPLNLLKRYNALLEITALSDWDRDRSLRSIFNRDFMENSASFEGRVVKPTTADGKDPMDILFAHLTTVETDKATKKRDFQMSRSQRLHWVRFHLDKRNPDVLKVFTCADMDGMRTYIWDTAENYVVILEPLRNIDAYYLLTAYPLEGKDAKRSKMEKKFQRRINAENA